jgi:hypothetical protein
VDVRQPAGVRQGVLDQNRIKELDQVLMRAAKPGWDLYHKWVKEGMSDLEARDKALEVVIPKDGPEFSDNPPDPLPLKDQEEIWRKLDLREQAKERLDELQKKRLPKT